LFVAGSRRQEVGLLHPAIWWYKDGVPQNDAIAVRYAMTDGLTVGTASYFRRSAI